ncbi:hypothetical protein K501DRAFT_336980 [Backusella circina FSU 941]|nr:hypothetical protein K501DRAFT_336980 [Backusella circina FSU 941]
MSDSSTRKSLFSRPLDLVYFIYFATHIPVTVCIDFQAFYPPEWVPQILKDALLMYTRDFKDPFMSSKEPTYWFLSFVVCELLVQLPFFFIACVGLVRDSKYIRLPLAVYGAHVATTVAPLLAEVLLNPAYDLTQSERYILSGFYAPYFILPLIMVLDSSMRVHKYLTVSSEKKNQ